MCCVCEILLLLIYVHVCDECLLNVWTVIRVCIFCGENIWGATATTMQVFVMAMISLRNYQTTIMVHILAYLFANSENTCIIMTCFPYVIDLINSLFPQSFKNSSDVLLHNFLNNVWFQSGLSKSKSTFSSV